MSRDELLTKLRALADEALVGTNPSEVQAAAAVLIALMAALKERRAKEFMAYALEWTRHQLRRLEARRN